jgi:hypothetical protein
VDRQPGADIYAMNQPHYGDVLQVPVLSSYPANVDACASHPTVRPFAPRASTEAGHEPGRPLGRSGLSVRQISLETGEAKWPRKDTIRHLADALELEGTGKPASAPCASPLAAAPPPQTKMRSAPDGKLPGIKLRQCRSLASEYRRARCHWPGLRTSLGSRSVSNTERTVAK